jgi:hypothetical protein
MNRDLERRLDSAESETGAATTDESSGPPLRRIEHRQANPEARPEGMAYDRETGTLAYDFWDAQRQVLSLLESGDPDVVAFLGGYRSGKTVTGGRWTLTGALQHPGSRWIAMGISYSEATGTTYRTLFEQLPGERTHLLTSSFNGPEQSPIVADYNRKEHRLTLINDSVIVLGSADKWSRYAGDEYAGIWLDEPSHYGSELYDILEMMGTRLTAPEGPKTMFWSLTGNGFNPAWSILEKQEDIEGDPIGSRIELVRASVLDNPYIDEADKARLRRQFEGSGREEQALHGGFEAAQGLVYQNFSRETHVLTEREAADVVDANWRIYGYDAGWNDPRVLLELGKTPYDQLVVLDEYHESEAHVEDALKWLNRNDKPRGAIYCEHVPSEIEKFKQANWPAEKASKSIDAGIADVRKRFEGDGNADVPDSPPRSGARGTGTFGNGHLSKGSKLRSAETIEREQERAEQAEREREQQADRVGLLVSERCQHLIRELLSYKHEHVGTSQAVDHCVDSLRYCVHTATSPDTDSRPTVGGIL